MARMHSRKKGKSGSQKPAVSEVPSWVTHTAKEVEQLVVKLAKEEKTNAEIGIALRDSYGIPSVKLVSGKTVSQILAANEMLPELPDDLRDLIRKSVTIRKHLENNGSDKMSKRGLQLTDSKILRLIRYYKESGRLPAEWKYNSKQAALYLH